MPADKGTGTRNKRRARRPDQIPDRPTALTKRQQMEQADARVQGAYQKQVRTQRGQKKLAGVEQARSRPKTGKAAVRDREKLYQQAKRDHSSANDLVNSLFGSAFGVRPLVSDAAWSFSHPVERLTDKGRAAGPDQMIWPGFGKNPRRPIKPAEATRLRDEYINIATKDYISPADDVRMKELGEILGIKRGGGGGPVPRSAPPRASVEAAPPGGRIGPPTIEEHVVDALPDAQKLRVKQEAGYAKVKGQRIAAADEARAAAGGGVEGYHAALRELRGELPKLRFGALEDLSPATVNKLMDSIAAHPDLVNRRWDVISAQRALTNVVEGRVPTRGDIKWLQKMFGTEAAQDVVNNVSLGQKAKEGLLNVLNIPRALKSSMDISAPFRQGLVLGARHPVIFARSWGPMLKAFGKEGAYESTMRDILSRPNAQLYADAKLALTDLEGGLALREEAFMSQIAEIVPGVRPSGRAYTVFLNKMRADAFDHYVRTAAANGKEFNTQELRAVARWINNATGRGGGDNKLFKDSLTGLNIGLFSPRLMASRVNLLNPWFYRKLHKQSPFAAQQAMRGAAQLAGAVSLTLWLAKMGGADVVMDPRSSDFGKIKIGDTRIDVAGGFTQYITFAAREITGQTKTEDGIEDLGPGYGERSRFDVGLRFARSKASPNAAYVYDAAEGLTFDYRPFDPKKEFGRLFLPIGFESTYDTYKEAGARPAALGAGLNAVGFGVQTYGPAEPKKKSSSKREPGPGSRRARRPDSSSGGGRRARRPD